MINQLKRRFVLIAMCGMILITLVIVGAINLINYAGVKSTINETLYFISSNEGHFPEEDDYKKPGMSDVGEPKGFQTGKSDNFKLGPESQFTTRFFAVWYDEDGNVIDVNTKNTASFSEDEAKDYTDKILSESKEEGRINNCCYIKTKTGSKTLIVCLDCSRDFEKCRQLAVISGIVAAASLFVEFLILCGLSGRVVRPIVVSSEKQKEFITDAGHELKTPITIISANTEVIEMTDGSSEWTESIKRQTARMTGLVNELVNLARLDEHKKVSKCTGIIMNEVVCDVIGMFRGPAAGRQLEIEMDASEEIIINGDEEDIRQILMIFLDNAVKYADENSRISVRLSKKGKSVLADVFNSCMLPEKLDTSKLFERFYRIDKSRSRETGGSGLGLSIAAAIAENNKNLFVSAKAGNGGINFRLKIKSE